VGLGRLELPTYGLGNRRSIHLSYSPFNNLQNLATILNFSPEIKAKNLDCNLSRASLDSLSGVWMYQQV
jgi:hypothetical protein